MYATYLARAVKAYDYSAPMMNMTWRALLDSKFPQPPRNDVYHEAMLHSRLLWVGGVEEAFPLSVGIQKFAKASRRFLGDFLPLETPPVVTLESFSQELARLIELHGVRRMESADLAFAFLSGGSFEKLTSIAEKFRGIYSKSCSDTGKLDKLLVELEVLRAFAPEPPTTVLPEIQPRLKRLNGTVPAIKFGEVRENSQFDSEATTLKSGEKTLKAPLAVVAESCRAGEENLNA